MPKEKKYRKLKFSPTRMILADYNDAAASLNRVQGLLEVDITDGLEIIQDIKKKHNYDLSMTAWIVYCVSKAVRQNMHMNSFRKGRKIIVFDDIDVSVIIEIVTKDGKQVPFNYVIKQADTKSVKEITDEIRSIQKKKIDEREQLTRESTKVYWFYPLLPRFFRRWVIKKTITNPFSLKKLIGTVGVTSLGMFVKNAGGWAIPFPDKTLNIAVGAIKENAKIIEGKAENRKILCLTFLVDHSIVDGAPIARFISQIVESMQNAVGLEI